MNEENGKPEPGPDAVDGTTISEGELQFDAEHRDWALQMFVGICNMSGAEISVTLNLGGCYVSGYIVKPEKYFDGLIADLQGANFHGDTAGEMRKMMENTLSSMKEMATPVPGKDDDPRGLRPRYIHLRAARFFAPNDLGHPFPSLPRGAWWKGKIAAVDGFQIGMPFPV
jgi:hypothetical protein